MIKTLPVLFLAFTLSGCPTNAHHDAVVAEHDFTLALQSLQQAEILEFQAGRIDAATHTQIENGIAQAATAAQVLVTSLQQSASNTTITQNFNSVASALVNLANSGAVGIKNPTSQQLIATLVKTAQAILSNVGSLLSVPTTTVTPATTPTTAPTTGAVQ